MERKIADEVHVAASMLAMEHYGTALEAALRSATIAFDATELVALSSVAEHTSEVASASKLANELVAESLRQLMSRRALLADATFQSDLPIGAFPRSEPLVGVRRDDVTVLKDTVIRPNRQTAGEVAPILVSTKDSRHDAVVQQVRQLLETTTFDWRTPESMGRELNLEVDEVRAALAEMKDDVRRPINPRNEERNFYRLTSRGTTAQEKFRRAKMFLGRIPPERRVTV